MKSALDTAERLLTAFEELVNQETQALRAMDFEEVATVRSQAAPLVEQLCALANEPGVQSLRPRIHAVLDQSKQNVQILAGQLAQVHGELNRLQEARGRVRNVAPAYQSGRERNVAAVTRFSAAA